MSDGLLVAAFVAWAALMGSLFVYAVNTYMDGPFDRDSRRTWFGRIDN